MELKKLIAVSLAMMISVCGMSITNIAVAKEQEVNGMEKRLQAEEILKKRPYGSYEYSYADSHYGYVSYRWKGSGLCIRETVKDGKLEKKEISLQGKAKKYAKKRDDYSICEWMDAKENFYFQTLETRNKKYVRFLNKVNKKGRLIGRIKLNDWLKIETNPKFHEKIKNYYMLHMEQVEGQEIIASYYDTQKIGYVIFDRDTGKVKRQITTEKNDGKSTSDWEFYHKQIQFTVSKDGRLFYEKVTAGKKITLPSGNKIRYQKVKKQKQIGQLPGAVEAGPAKRMFASWKNYVYLLAPEGYYRINTKDLSLEKLASTSELPFWKNEYSDIEFSTLVVLSKKKCIFSLYNYTDDVSIEDTKMLIWQGTIS